MTVSAVRLNHAVLFVSRPRAQPQLLPGRLRHGGRGPRAAGRAAFLRLPRSGNHHDLGLFGVGAQPPRPRGGLGLYHLAWQVDTIEELEQARQTLAELDALTGESSHGATKSVYAARPRRQRVRGHVDAPPRRVGRRTPTPRRSTGSTSRARCARWGGVRTAAELVPLDPADMNG